jgi:hypothetical protein
MKKSILYSTILVAWLFAGIGCKKFLDKEPQGVYTANQFYQTSDQAVEAVNAAYAPLRFTNATNNPLWVFGDIASDDAESGNPGDQPNIDYIDQFTYNSTNGNLSAEWGNFYEGITCCNLVLANVPSINMDTTLRNRILGEAKFLRAWYYFMLVNIYGDIPVVTTPLDYTQLQVSKTAAASIYVSVIEPDLKAAMTLLPLNYDKTTDATDIGRATGGAAIALLAKVYLYQQKWDSASTYALQVINSGQYSLMPVYREDFDADHKNNSESIFEVQMLSGQTNPATGDALNQWFAPSIENGYQHDVPTQSFVNEFEKTPAGVYDPRLDYTIGRDSMPWFNGEIFSKTWSSTGYLTKKYQQPFSEIPASLKGDGSCNYLAIRYADILLIYAEALNEQGLTSDALIPLNQVRKRARESYLYDSTLTAFGTVPANLLPDITAIDQTTVRAAIQHERRVEFGFEFHRFFDVIRWGATYATQAMSTDSVATGFNYANNKHFPIPQSELQTDRALTP